MRYADVIYYNDDGILVDRIFLPFVDSLTPNIGKGKGEERITNMSQIFVGESHIEHVWYEDYFNRSNTDTTYTIYSISRNGFDCLWFKACRMVPKKE